MSWRQATWLFVDTETTGLKVSQGARVMELGFALVKNMNVAMTMNWVLDPEVPIPPEVQSITGVKPEDVVGKPKFGEVAHQFHNIIAKSDFVMAYNVKFDKEMIENEFKLVNLRMPDKQWLDPLIWIRRFVKLGDHKLKTVAQHFKVDLDRAHRADADAAAAAQATIKFIDTFEGKALPDDPKELGDLEKAWDADEREIRRAKYQSKTKVQKS